MPATTPTLTGPMPTDTRLGTLGAADPSLAIGKLSAPNPALAMPAMTTNAMSAPPSLGYQNAGGTAMTNALGPQTSPNPGATTRPVGVPPSAAPGAQTNTVGIPHPTPYGDFTAPTSGSLASDPGFQFRLAQGNQAAQRSAAAHGTLLTGGLQKSLANYNQGMASDEYGNAYNRALSSYTANRDTNQQNYGQLMGEYTAQQAAAQQAAALAEQQNRDRLARDQFAYGQTQDTYAHNLDQSRYNDQRSDQSLAQQQAQQQQSAAQDYARWAANERQNAATAALGGTRGTLQPPQLSSPLGGRRPFTPRIGPENAPTATPTYGGS